MITSKTPRSSMTVLSLKTLKPRNPLVGPALLRQAGKHANGNRRQAAQRALQQQLSQLDSP